MLLRLVLDGRVAHVEQGMADRERSAAFDV
jgi:hypothetical protein